MITFDLPDARFTYRVAGIFRHDDHVLLCTVDGIDFWFVPGGRCEAGEASTDTVVREMREELGVDTRVKRLLWVGANFFTYAGRACHELGFYYLMALPPGSPLLDMDKTFYSDEGGQRITCRRFSLDELERTRLYPEFLRTALRRIPDTIEHVINRDSKDEDTDY